MNDEVHENALSSSHDFTWHLYLFFVLCNQWDRLIWDIKPFIVVPQFEAPQVCAFSCFLQGCTYYSGSKDLLMDSVCSVCVCVCVCVCLLMFSKELYVYTHAHTVCVSMSGVAELQGISFHFYVTLWIPNPNQPKTLFCLCACFCPHTKQYMEQLHQKYF